MRVLVRRARAATASAGEGEPVGRHRRGRPRRARGGRGPLYAARERRVLEYSDVDTSRVRKQYEKVKRQIEADDLRSADLKKLGQGGLYRANSTTPTA